MGTIGALGAMHGISFSASYQLVSRFANKAGVLSMSLTHTATSRVHFACMPRQQPRSSLRWLTVMFLILRC